MSFSKHALLAFATDTALRYIVTMAGHNSAYPWVFLSFGGGRSGLSLSPQQGQPAQP